MSILSENNEITTESLLMSLYATLHDSKDSIEREEKLFLQYSQLFSKLLSEVLEKIDQKLYEDVYKKQGYRVCRRDSRTIYCLWGELTYKRRLLKNRQGKNLYPLDKKLGFEPRKRYSLAVSKRISEAMGTTTSRHASELIQELTPIAISHQTVVATKNKNGKKVKEYQAAKAAEVPDKKETPSDGILVIEGDGIVLKGKGGKKEELHRLQIYTGVKKVGNRTELTGRHCFSSLDRKNLVEQVNRFIHNHYNLEETTVLSNGDGGAGYQCGDFAYMADGCKRHFHFLDRYHVNEKIRTRLSFCRKDLVERIIRELSEASDIRPLIPVWIDTAGSQAKTDKDVEEIERLRAYLERNADYIPSLKQRGIKTSIHLGTAETNHRSYSYRLKRQGRVWSHQGLEYMAAVLTAKKNGELDEALLYEAAGKNYKKNDRALKKATGIAKKEAKAQIQAKNVAKRHISRGYRPGCVEGRIACYGPSSSPMGRLAAAIQNY